jgi:DNA adenine methylase
MNNLRPIAPVGREEKLTVVFKREVTAKSLLRYPGGKTRAIDMIVPYFPKNISAICSPFFGGGSIELWLAAKGDKVYGYDIFTPLVEFWQCVIKSPNELAKVAEQYYPLTRSRFYDLQKKQMKFGTKMERAAVYYVLNRSSFSGATLSGGMSPEHPRFKRTSIERLREFYNPNFSVEKLDFERSIILHKNTFTYLDPPYLIESALYGKKGNTHKNFDHVKLSGLLKQRVNWILSYNDCPEIRELYAGFHIIAPEWKYGMSTDKSSREVLIFSADIIPDRNANTNRRRQRHLNTRSSPPQEIFFQMDSPKSLSRKMRHSLVLWHPISSILQTNNYDTCRLPQQRSITSASLSPTWSINYLMPTRLR